MIITVYGPTALEMDTVIYYCTPNSMATGWVDVRVPRRRPMVYRHCNGPEGMGFGGMPGRANRQHCMVISMRYNGPDSMGVSEIPRRVNRRPTTAHLDILKWAPANGCPWSEYTCVCAELKGHLEVLQWARANGCPWFHFTCTWAAQNRHVRILQWAAANGGDWNSTMCGEVAAYYGQLESLKWARHHGCPWSPEVCEGAAINGHLHVLQQWARDHGRNIYVHILVE